MPKIDYKKDKSSPLGALLELEEKKTTPKIVLPAVLPALNEENALNRMKPREKRFLREVDGAIQKALNGNSQGLIKQSILWREEGFSENAWRKYVRILVNMGRYAIDSSPRGTIFTCNAAIIIH
jgi:hypothetical protein